MSKNTDMGKYFFKVTSEDFKKIPGHPIAYWLTENVYNLFSKNNFVGDTCDAFKGLSTGENDLFIRAWHEVSITGIYFGCLSNQESASAPLKWYPCNKGGSFRRWSGNYDSVINWQNDGAELRSLTPKSVIRNPNNYFIPCISWSKVTSGSFSTRYFKNGYVPLDSSSSLISKKIDSLEIISLTNSSPFSEILSSLSETLKEALNKPHPQRISW